MQEYTQQTEVSRYLGLLQIKRFKENDKEEEFMCIARKDIMQNWSNGSWQMASH